MLYMFNSHYSLERFYISHETEIQQKNLIWMIHKPKKLHALVPQDKVELFTTQGWKTAEELSHG